MKALPVSGLLMLRLAALALLAAGAAAQVVGPLVIEHASFRAEFAVVSNAPLMGQRVELRRLRNKLAVALGAVEFTQPSGGWTLRFTRQPAGGVAAPWMEVSMDGGVVHADPFAPIGTLDALVLQAATVLPGGTSLAAQWLVKVTIDAAPTSIVVRTGWDLVPGQPAVDSSARLDILTPGALPYYVGELVTPKLMVTEFESAPASDGLLVPYSEGTVIDDPTEGLPGTDGLLLPKSLSRAENQPCDAAAYWEGGALSRCLLAAPTDGSENWKELRVQATPGAPGFVSLAWAHLPPDVFAMRTWTLPYAVRLGVLQGDWWDAADAYRGFLATSNATSAWYHGPVGSPANPMPKVAKDLVAEVFLFNAFKGDNLDLLARAMLDLHRLLGDDVLAAWYGGWSPDRFDHWFLDGGYLPGRPSFAAAVREGQANHALVMPYIQGGTVADCSDPVLGGGACDGNPVLSAAQDAALLDEELRPVTFPAAEGPPRDLFLSPRSPWWLSFLPQHAADITEFTDAGAAYLDYFLVAPDFDPSSDGTIAPPPGGGSYMFLGREQQVAALQAARGPDFVVAQETLEERLTGQVQLMHADPAALLVSDTAVPSPGGGLVPISLPNAHIVPFFRAVHDNVKLSRIVGGNAYGAPSQRAWVEAVSVLSFGRIPSYSWSFSEIASPISQRYPFASFLGLLGGASLNDGKGVPGQFNFNPCDGPQAPNDGAPPTTTALSKPGPGALDALCKWKPREHAPFHRHLSGLTASLRDAGLLTWHNGTIQRLPSYAVVPPPGFAGLPTVDPDPADGLMTVTPVHIEALPGAARDLVPGMFRAPLDAPDPKDRGSLAFVLCNPWVDPAAPASMQATFSFQPQLYAGWTSSTVYSVEMVVHGVHVPLAAAVSGDWTQPLITLPPGDIRWWIFRRL